MDAVLYMRQFEAICAKVLDCGIEEAPENMPEDLDTTYERIVDKINNKPQAQRELAWKALRFITYATQPVSMDTLALALAVKDSTQSLDTLRSSIPTEQTILNACGNLIAIHEDSNVRHVRFVHFSVHEYLSSDRSSILHTGYLEYEPAHREIARMCMNFLLILCAQVRDHCTAVESSFTKYILHALPRHLLAGNLNSLPPNNEIVNLTLSFFEKCPPLLAPSFDFFEDNLILFTFSPPVLALIFNLPGTYQCYDPQVLCGKQLNQEVVKWVFEKAITSFEYFILLSDNRLAMHYAIGQLDSVAVAQRLYNHGYPIDYSHHISGQLLNIVHNLPSWKLWLKYDTPNVWELTPFYLVKSVEMAKFLLESGASVKPQVVDGKVRDLLEHLAESEKTEVVQLLFDSLEQYEGASLHHAAYHSKVEIMLHNAAYRGRLGTMRFLLEKGASVNAHGGKYGNALHAAAYRGEVEAMKLLLSNGADVNALGGRYGNALQGAAYSGEVEAMQLLLDNGADVSAQGGMYGNAFIAAVISGQVGVMQILLDNGADPHTQGGRHGTGLQTAAADGSIDAMKLLLDRGVDVNAQGGWYGNALQAAAEGGHIEAMQLLLDKGVDVNATGGWYGNALQAAAYSSNMEAMRFLLDNGANAHAQGGRHYGNSLQAAAYSGNTEGMRLLLDNGVDVNTEGGYYGNALQAAAYSSNIDTMRLLLDQGADVNAHGGCYGSALLAAAYNGTVEAVRCLLDKGADLNFQEKHYGDVLQTAASSGKVETMQLLLDRGVDWNTQGGYYGNVLQAAASSGKADAVRLLLDKGIDVNIQGGRYGNALQAVAVRGNIEAMQLLLDKGADVNALGGYFDNALQAAACSGKVEALKLLIDNGADVNAQGGQFGNSLQAVAIFGNVKAIQLLLDQGVDVNAQGGMYGNALQAAAYSGKVESMRLLLDHGADVNARGGKFGTALQAALVPAGKVGDPTQAALRMARIHSALHMVEILLDHGADITAHVPDSEYGDVLGAAKELWRHDCTNLARFMKLLEARGVEGGRIG